MAGGGDWSLAKNIYTTGVICLMKQCGIAFDMSVYYLSRLTLTTDEHCCHRQRKRWLRHILFETISHIDHRLPRLLAKSTMFVFNNHTLATRFNNHTLATQLVRVK